MDEGLEIAAKGIFERAKAVILTPNDEWPKIEAETKDRMEILKTYVLPLAAIGPISSLIGGQVFGVNLIVATYRQPIVGAIITAVVSYALAIAVVYVLAFIADFLAPKFDGQANKANAFKLVAYGSTASWAAGIFSLVPALAFFGLLGLYSVYLYYTAAAPLMKVPQDKAVAFTAVTILCAIVLAIIVAPITALLTGLAGFGGPLSIAGSTNTGGTVTLPGMGSVDLSKVENAANQMEAATSGKSPPVPAASMQALLPSSIGAYQRTATETMAMGAMGSTAEGTYTSGDNRFTLKIVDMSALGALAGLGAAMGAQQSREDANGYERTSTVNGQMQKEAWNKTNGRGEFGVVMASSFMVAAEG